MKVFFIGSVSFSSELLKLLLVQPEIEIVGLATKSGSRFNADHSDLSDLISDTEIPFKYIKDINASHNIVWVRSLNPDVIFCFGWSSLIKSELLSLAPKGVIGYHPAELPLNRGRHPIIWALVLGLKTTASTFFRMTEDADSGDIASQRTVGIELTDDAKSLYLKLLVTAKQQIKEFVPELAKDSLIFRAQDHSRANYWRKRGIKDGEIDFRMTSMTIYNLVRGLTTPYVGAHIILEGREVKVWKSLIYEGKIPVNYEPGKVIKTSQNGEILVKTGDGAIWLTDHELRTLPEKNRYLI